MQPKKTEPKMQPNTSRKKRNEEKKKHKKGKERTEKIRKQASNGFG